MRRLVEHYIRSALPFATGLAFGIGAGDLSIPLAFKVVLGAALVVIGPFVIDVVLTLIVEALHGPDATVGDRVAPGSPVFRARRRL